MIKCKCKEITKLHGREAQDYAGEHLKEIIVDSVNWQVLYVCPETGIFWKEYFPHSEYHGGGAPDMIQITEEEARKEFRF